MLACHSSGKACPCIQDLRDQVIQAGRGTGDQAWHARQEVRGAGGRKTRGSEEMTPGDSFSSSLF